MDVVPCLHTVTITHDPYAYFPPTDHKHSPFMHIVAPGPLTDDVRAYITFMNKTFGLSFKYHQLAREMEQFDLAGEHNPD